MKGNFMKLFGALLAGLLLLSTASWAEVTPPATLKPTQLRTYGAVAPATIYVFTSFSCPHCATFHAQIFPELLKQTENGSVQVVLVEMPYDAKAMTATMLGRCLPPQNYEKFAGAVFDNQTAWYNASDPKSIMTGYAKMLGLNEADADACTRDKDLQFKIMEQRNNLSNLYGVTGMPTTVYVKGNTIKKFVGSDKNAVLNGVAELMKNKK